MCPLTFVCLMNSLCNAIMLNGSSKKAKRYSIVSPTVNMPRPLLIRLHEGCLRGLFLLDASNMPMHVGSCNVAVCRGMHVFHKTHDKICTHQKDNTQHKMKCQNKYAVHTL